MDMTVQLGWSSPAAITWQAVRAGGPVAQAVQGHATNGDDAVRARPRARRARRGVAVVADERVVAVGRVPSNSEWG